VNNFKVNNFKVNHTKDGKLAVVRDPSFFEAGGRGVKSEYEMRDSYLILRIGQELDHHEAEHIRQILEKAGRERYIRNILFDFSETVFMDSSGVGLLIHWYKELMMVGGRVCAAGVCPAVSKLFYVSGLHKIIRVYPEVEDVFYGQK
jgi:stage II sporulation protein AA (anti-sigma F factor antagonist)